MPKQIDTNLNQKIIKALEELEVINTKDKLVTYLEVRIQLDEEVKVNMEYTPITEKTKDK